MRESFENRRKEGQCLRQRSRVLHLPLNWVSPCFVPSLFRAALTSITRRKPSSTSRSFLLSSNFFICAGGICLTDRRPAPASRAASSVRSRAATGQTGFLVMVYVQTRLIIPVSSIPEIRDIDSILAVTCLGAITNSNGRALNVWRG